MTLLEQALQKYQEAKDKKDPKNEERFYRVYVDWEDNHNYVVVEMTEEYIHLYPFYIGEEIEYHSTDQQWQTVIEAMVNNGEICPVPM